MESKDGQQGQAAAAAAGNAQRIPGRMLAGRRGNTELRNGKCYILSRSQMDPRAPYPQLIDETYTDRNRRESLNLALLNPDLPRRTSVKCLCTRVIHLQDDWYVYLHDGTVLCNSCTRCFRCFTICFTAGRKLNSTDGLVLCNRCMLSYGCYREPRIKIRLKPMPRLFDDTEHDANTKQQQQQQPEQQQPEQQRQNANQAEEGGHNTAVALRRKWRCSAGSNASNSRQVSSVALGRPSGSSHSDAAAAGSVRTAPEPLEKPRYRDEGRRILRKIYYPNPRAEDYGRPDYRFEAPPYMGVDRNNGPQACPECNRQALSQALVVPGYARVYHERSFRCANCKRPMHMGYQTPGAQFQGCNCPQQPRIWCLSAACQQARQTHHAEKRCHLAPVHPGGRPKRDVPGILPRFDPEENRKAELQALKDANRLQVSWTEQQRKLQQKAVAKKRK